MSRRKRHCADTVDEPPEGPMTHVLREALGRVASPDARDSVLFMALADGGLTVVPDDPTVFRRFALGPLRRAMTLTLSDDLADAVLTDLTPIIERAASTITSGQRGATSATHGLALLLGTADGARASAWIQAAPEGTRSRIVDDVFDLVSGVDAMRQLQLSVVLDSSMPSMSPSALSTLSLVLPLNASVVLLGFLRQGGLPDGWHLLPGNAPVAQVISAAFPVSTHTGEHAIDLDAGPVHTGPARVLVIDDDNAFRAGIVHRLRGLEMVVTSAPDAFVGLEMAADDRPDVIVLGGALGDLDAERFCALVKRMMGEDGPGIVVLVDDRSRVIPGAAEVLVRGVDDDRLPEVVEASR